MNAIFYVSRQGVNSAIFLKNFQIGGQCILILRKWRDQRLFEKINHHSPKSLTKINEKPTAGIVDNQSVKITEKGSLKVMMGRKKSMVVKDIF